MNGALLVVSAGLATVFAVAGIAKLVDSAGSRSAARSFGVPVVLAPAAAVMLPLVELAIAALLLPTATRWVASVAALVLLLVFCVAIGVAMARGRAPECHCFGQLHSAPAGWRTLARNGVLTGAAAFVVLAGRDDAGFGAFTWVSRLDGVDWLAFALAVTLTVVLALGGYAVAHALRSYGLVLVRLDALEGRLRAAGFDLDEPEEVPQLGLQPGTSAPAFWLPTVDGDRVALDDLLKPGKPALLLFTSPTCGPCAHLMPAVAAWQRDHADALTIALLSAGEPAEVRAEAAGHGLANVLLDESLTAYESYEANGTPSAVLVGDDGTIASWLAAGSEWIETLVEQALDGLGRTPGLPVGAEVPALRVDRLDGGESALGDVIERESVVLLWNPGCGFCRAMHDDVRAWEASPPPDGPGLVIVSAGSSEDVRAEAFVSPVLLDPSGSLATALGADGTPMALLVDADGRVASPLAAGSGEVLALLGARHPAVSNL